MTCFWHLAEMPSTCRYPLSGQCGNDTRGRLLPRADVGRVSAVSNSAPIPVADRATLRWLIVRFGAKHETTPVHCSIGSCSGLAVRMADGGFRAEAQAPARRLPKPGKLRPRDISRQAHGRTD